MWSYTQAENHLKMNPQKDGRNKHLYTKRRPVFFGFWRSLIFWLDFFVGSHVIFHRPNLIRLMVGGYRRHLRNLLNRLIARWFQMFLLFTPQNWGKMNPILTGAYFSEGVGLKTKPPPRMARIFHLWHLECVGTTVITRNDWQLLKVSFRGYPALNLEDFWNLHPRKNQS